MPCKHFSKHHNHSTPSPNKVHVKAQAKTQISIKALSWHEKRSTWDYTQLILPIFKPSGDIQRLKSYLANSYFVKISVKESWNVMWVQLSWTRILLRKNEIARFDASNLNHEKYGALSLFWNKGTLAPPHPHPKQEPSLWPGNISTSYALRSGDKCTGVRWNDKDRLTKEKR